MKTLAHNKLIASVLVCAGFAAWLTSARLVDGEWGSYIVGSAAFFMVACFLPETKRTTFLSRRSSLGLVGLFIWLAADQAFMHEHWLLGSIDNPMVSSTLDVGLPIILALGGYWLSIYLIRGFRAQPEYNNRRGEQDEAGQPPLAALSSDITSDLNTTPSNACLR